MLKAGPVTVAGCMSGTSLDGVDVAVLVTDGVQVLGRGETRYRAYSEEARAVLRAALGLWVGPPVAAAAAVVEGAHAEALAGLACDLVGFHGQTTAHDPGGRGTCQVGDGERLAGQLGRPVVWDFRSADVTMGGQGAPLAPLYHHALMREAGLGAPVAVLNLGGVGNLTWIDPGAEDPTAPGALVAFDTGPANAPINDLMEARRGAAFDAGGALARSGTVEEGVVTAFLSDPWFEVPPPKSLDRDAFAGLMDAVAVLPDADAAATLTACAPMAVARGAEHCPEPPVRVLVCGGGRRNPVLMEMLAAALSCPVEPIETLGRDGDMIEAEAFAFLAVRVARGLPTSVPGTTGVRAPVSGGTLSSPAARITR